MKRTLIGIGLALLAGMGLGLFYWFSTQESRARQAELAGITAINVGPSIPMPQLPSAGRRASVDEWPSKELLGQYSLQIGVLADVSDADAQWLLGLATRHPDSGVRLTTISQLYLAFGDDKKGELRRSLATQATRDAITQLLIEKLGSTVVEERFNAAICVCSGRLWRDPILRSALEYVRNDPDEALQRWMKLCWNEVDASK